MEIRDPVHGSIHILDEEIPIIENPVFQRLRGIKQLGLSEYVFPGATHTRYLHSIGVFSIAESAFTRLFQDKVTNKDFLRLKETLKLAALLHDIGHAPLSHATEVVMPSIHDLKLPSHYLKNRDSKKATHEDYTVKSIIDGPLTDAFTKVKQKFGVIPDRVAELVTGYTIDKSYFTIGKINYFPLLHQLVSSEMDCDRMDYLLRDSYFCGVSYGHFDLDWILDNLEMCAIDGDAYLGISERAISTFDDFLLGRFHMFLMVYFHYKAVCMEQILVRYFNTSKGEYSIPSKIEDYINHDDHYLMKVLRSSDNIYAKQIIKNNIPPKVFECFGPKNISVISEIEKYLKTINVEYIRCSSKGRLSKYYQTGKKAVEYPLKVVRKFHDIKIFVNISEATDLFQKFSHAHSVNRLHCYLDQTTQKQRGEIFSIIKKSSGQVK